MREFGGWISNNIMDNSGEVIHMGDFDRLLMLMSMNIFYLNLVTSIPWSCVKLGVYIFYTVVLFISYNISMSDFKMLSFNCSSWFSESKLRKFTSYFFQLFSTVVEITFAAIFLDIATTVFWWYDIAYGNKSKFNKFNL